MTNITKGMFDNLEQEIDLSAKNKTLGSSEAKPYLDEYYSKIIDYSKQANDITGNTDFDKLSQYSVVPMNFKERYGYVIEHKYHLMGYRQMKTFRTKLIKTSVSCQTRLKNKRV